VHKRRSEMVSKMQEQRAFQLRSMPPESSRVRDLAGRQQCGILMVEVDGMVVRAAPIHED